ncbi:MAG: hypothetical protein WA159_02940 [Variovorax sp.]
MVVNIHLHGFDEIAALIQARTRTWRCDTLMATVASNGDIRCRDIGKEASRNDALARDIIGTFSRDAQIEDIEDAVIEQKRSMRITPGRGKEVML